MDSITLKPIGVIHSPFTDPTSMPIQPVSENSRVNVDVTFILDSYYADANKTYLVGTSGPDARKIVSMARECLRCGMAMVKPNNSVGDIGWAIQTYAESQGCAVVREFVGHGVGFDFHEPPKCRTSAGRKRGLR